MFAYPIVSDVMLGDSKQAIEEWLTPYLKPLPPAAWIPLVLLIVFMLVHFGIKLSELKKVEDELEGEKSKVDSLEKRLAIYQDHAIQNPRKVVAATKQDEKLDLIKEKMAAYVRGSQYLIGIQIFNYTMNTGQIYVERTAEFVDNITSWTGKAYIIDSKTQRQFNLAVRTKREQAFIDQYSQVVATASKESLNDMHVFQYACLNVASKLLEARNIKHKLQFDIRRRDELFEINDRIGILESILYIDATNRQGGYIFRKQGGDFRKRGRFYLAYPMKIDLQPHVALFIFDKTISDGVTMDKLAPAMHTIADDFFEVLVK